MASSGGSGNSGFSWRSLSRSVPAVSPSQTTQTTAAVIPCFNEGPHIGPLVAAVRPLIPKVWVIDDGSSDDTSSAARAAGAEVIRHEQNLGKGAALRAGLDRARTEGFGWALLMDGDGQHAPADIPALLAARDTGVVDLIVGNRMADPAGMPWLRRQVNRWMSRRISRLAGVALPDTQCGFRLIRLTAWSELACETSRFEIESEMLIAFVTAGRQVRFVPVQTIYRASQSKIHPWRDTVRWFRWWRKATRTVRR